MELNLHDILELKKEHPCGSKCWEVLRVGMELGVNLTTPYFKSKFNLTS